MYSLVLFTGRNPKESFVIESERVQPVDGGPRAKVKWYNNRYYVAKIIETSDNKASLEDLHVLTTGEIGDAEESSTDEDTKSSDGDTENETSAASDILVCLEPSSFYDLSTGDVATVLETSSEVSTSTPDAYTNVLSEALQTPLSPKGSRPSEMWEVSQISRASESSEASEPSLILDPSNSSGASEIATEGEVLNSSGISREANSSETSNISDASNELRASKESKTSNNLEVLDTYEVSKASKASPAPHVLEVLNTSEISETSRTSEAPNALEVSDTSEVLEASKASEAANALEVSNTFEVSETSKRSQAPNTSEVSATSEVSEARTVSEASNTSRTLTSPKHLQTLTTAEPLKVSKTPLALDMSKAVRLLTSSTIDTPHKEALASRLAESAIADDFFGATILPPLQFRDEVQNSDTIAMSVSPPAVTTNQSDKSRQNHSSHCSMAAAGSSNCHVSPPKEVELVEGSGVMISEYRLRVIMKKFKDKNDPPSMIRELLRELVGVEDLKQMRAKGKEGWKRVPPGIMDAIEMFVGNHYGEVLSPTAFTRVVTKFCGYLRDYY